MKNINSNWLGTPPEHWKALKLRQILRPFSEKNHADLQLLSVVREKGVIVRDTENDDNHNYIQESFSRYYRTTILSGETDPNKLYDLISAMEKHQVYSRDDIENEVNLYLNGAQRDKLDYMENTECYPGMR